MSKFRPSLVSDHRKLGIEVILEIYLICKASEKEAKRKKIAGLLANRNEFIRTIINHLMEKALTKRSASILDKLYEDLTEFSHT